MIVKKKTFNLFTENMLAKFSDLLVSDTIHILRAQKCSVILRRQQHQCQNYEEICAQLAMLCARYMHRMRQWMQRVSQVSFTQEYNFQKTSIRNNLSQAARFHFIVIYKIISCIYVQSHQMTTIYLITVCSFVKKFNIIKSSCNYYKSKILYSEQKLYKIPINKQIFTGRCIVSMPINEITFVSENVNEMD